MRTRRLIESRLLPGAKFVAVPHHLAHGASSFYASGFERAAVISADHRGDLTTTALMTGIGHELHINAEAHFPNSLGLVYNAVTAALGFDYEGDWHKTMWLAPTGENRFADLFSELLAVDRSGLPVINQAFFEIDARGITSMATRHLLDELLGAWQARSGRPVQLVATGGVDAFRRVESGEAFDFVVLAADARTFAWRVAWR